VVQQLRCISCFSRIKNPLRLKKSEAVAVAVVASVAVDFSRQVFQPQRSLLTKVVELLQVARAQPWFGKKQKLQTKADVKDPSGTGVYTGGGVVSNTGGGGIVSNTGVVPPMVGGIGLGGGGIQDVSPSAPPVTTSTRPRVGAIGSRYGGSTSAGSRVDPKFLGFVDSKPKYEFN
jgi:hypothetical protein